jgi:hypothetical protein
MATRRSTRGEDPSLNRFGAATVLLRTTVAVVDVDLDVDVDVEVCGRAVSARSPAPLNSRMRCGKVASR